MNAAPFQVGEAPSRQGAFAEQAGWLLRAGLLRWSALGISAIAVVWPLLLAYDMLMKPQSANPLIRDLFLVQIALWVAIFIKLHAVLFLGTGRHQRVMVSPTGAMTGAGILVVGLPLAVALSAVVLGAFSTWSWMAIVTAALFVMATLAWLIRPGSSSAAQIVAGLFLMILGFQGVLLEVVLPMFRQPCWEMTAACGVLAGWQLAWLHYAFRHHPGIAVAGGSYWFDRFGWAIRWRSAPAAGPIRTTMVDLVRHTLNLRRALFGSWWWVPISALATLALISVVTWLTGNISGERPRPTFGLLAVFGIMGAAACQAVAATPDQLRRLAAVPLSRALAIACVWSATALSSVWMLVVFVGLSVLIDPLTPTAANVPLGSSPLLPFLIVIPSLAACAGLLRLVELLPWPILRALITVALCFAALHGLFLWKMKELVDWQLFIASGYAAVAVVTHLLALRWWLRVDLDATSRGTDVVITGQAG